MHGGGTGRHRDRSRCGREGDLRDTAHRGPDREAAVPERGKRIHRPDGRPTGRPECRAQGTATAESCGMSGAVPLPAAICEGKSAYSLEASDYESGGRGFEPLWVRHFTTTSPAPHCGIPAERRASAYAPSGGASAIPGPGCGRAADRLVARRLGVRLAYLYMYSESARTLRCASRRSISSTRR